MSTLVNPLDIEFFNLDSYDKKIATLALDIVDLMPEAPEFSKKLQEVYTSLTKLFSNDSHATLHAAIKGSVLNELQRAKLKNALSFKLSKKVHWLSQYILERLEESDTHLVTFNGMYYFWNGRIYTLLDDILLNKMIVKALEQLVIISDDHPPVSAINKCLRTLINSKEDEPLDTSRIILCYSDKDGNAKWCGYDSKVREGSRWFEMDPDPKYFCIAELITPEEGEPKYFLEAWEQMTRDEYDPTAVDKALMKVSYQLFCTYASHGNDITQQAFYWKGKPGTGKSTQFHAFKSWLPTTKMKSMVYEENLGTALATPLALKNMQGKLFFADPDITNAFIKNSSVLKKATSGESISSRDHHAQFEFNNCMTSVFMISNELIKIHDAAGSMRRRMNVLNLHGLTATSFPGGNFKEAIEDELPQILNLVINNFKKLCDKGEDIYQAFLRGDYDSRMDQITLTEYSQRSESDVDSFMTKYILRGDIPLMVPTNIIYPIMVEVLKSQGVSKNFIVKMKEFKLRLASHNTPETEKRIPTSSGSRVRVHNLKISEDLFDEIAACSATSPAFDKAATQLKLWKRQYKGTGNQTTPLSNSIEGVL